MSIWTIQETEKSICFVECHPNELYQAWDIIQFMDTECNNSPVQVPFIGCWDDYENCLCWLKS